MFRLGWRCVQNRLIVRQGPLAETLSTGINERTLDAVLYADVHLFKHRTFVEGWDNWRDNEEIEWRGHCAEK